MENFFNELESICTCQAGVVEYFDEDGHFAGAELCPTCAGAGYGNVTRNIFIKPKTPMSVAGLYDHTLALVRKLTGKVVQ